MTITIRIGKLITDQNRQDAALTAAALRQELARLAAERGVAKPASAALRQQNILQSATPAGRGREAAARVFGALK